MIPQREGPGFRLRGFERNLLPASGERDAAPDLVAVMLEDQVSYEGMVPFCGVPLRLQAIGAGAPFTSMLGSREKDDAGV